MCSRYYLEPSPELLPIIERTRRCHLTQNMIIHLGRPLKKGGVVCPDDMVPVITPDLKMISARMPVMLDEADVDIWIRPEKVPKKIKAATNMVAEKV